MGRESPSTRNGDRILRMVKVAGERERVVPAVLDWRTNARETAARRVAEESDAARGVTSGMRGGSRAYWVDGCWYGFQEEREGEG